MNKNELLNVYKNHITEVTHTTCGETYVEVSRDYLYELVTEVVSMLNGTLMTMFCVDELKYNHKNSAASKNSRYKIYYAFRIQSANKDEIKKELLVITISVGEKEPEIASITDICLAANWYEREIFDMFGIYPRNHLELAGLIHHHDFPKDVFPMRKDFAASTKIAEVNKIEAKPKVLGGGTYLLPVGPIHAGIIEPGHFRFSCFGEHIINLDAQLFYTHKGLEKITEGMNHINANFIAERVCGVCSLSHSVAYSQAVEKITSAEVPARARTIRVILLELERMAGHLTDLMG
ncbi:MAG: membrane-bound [NiFe]-hydrogenase-3, large subunit (Chain E), partial [uncultured bacterium]